MNAELRWTPARFLDMAVFYDTGKVAARKEDLDFEDLEDSYGIGMRFIGLKGYAFQGRSGAQPGAPGASARQRRRSILMKTITTRTRLALVAGTLALAAVAAGANGQKFYPDDPIARIVDSQDASGVQAGDRPGLRHAREPVLLARIGHPTSARRTSTRSMKCRTRTGSRTGWGRPVTVDELVKGPASGTGPAPGSWTVISAKNDGVMPGFTVRDSAGQVWFIKFDPPGYPAMATGTEVLVSRLFWGLGYHVPETIWPRCRSIS